MLLDIKKLTKSFNKKYAVSDVTFGLNQGEILSIIGPSGSGKSTLLKLIGNLEKPDSGDVTIDGLDVFKSTKIKRQAAYQKIGYIFQDFALFDHLSVRENIGLASKIVYKKDQMWINDQTNKLLNMFGLIDKLDVYPITLSGGEKQRVAIARALITNPSILMFDEPTSALDLKSVNDLISIIKQLKKDNIGILIVTHDLNFAKQVSDRLLFMRDSSIIFNRDMIDVADINLVFDS
ncbi:MAG: ATP-binding cassette domain-containing protein [Acholeplasma sp.]